MNTLHDKCRIRLFFIMINFNGPVINLKNLPVLPGPGAQLQTNASAPMSTVPEFTMSKESKLIHTPSFTIDTSSEASKEPKNEEEILFHIHYHQNLEILERRIRNKTLEFSTTTDNVAAIYYAMDGFVINKDEISLLDNYDRPFDNPKIPTFWEPRSYDIEGNSMTEKESDELSRQINEELEINFTKRSDRPDSKDFKVLLESTDDESDTPKKNKYNPNWYLPHPPVKGYHRNHYNSRFLVSWRIENVLTDNSDCNTDSEDFVL